MMAAMAALSPGCMERTIIRVNVSKWRAIYSNVLLKNSAIIDPHRHLPGDDEAGLCWYLPQAPTRAKQEGEITITLTNNKSC
jgi:hypothetical protein